MPVHWLSGEADTQINNRDREVGGEDDNGTVTLWKHEVKLFLGQSLHGEAF